jgi:hypothetical protein
MEQAPSIAPTFLTQREVAELLRLPERTLEDWRLTQIAAPTQVAADLLNGPGRNPSEAEELLAWMSAHEGAWRK